MPEAEVEVREVKALKTRSGNTRFVLVDENGNEYSTFKEAIARDALAAERKRARIEYHAPADASSTGLPGASVDVVFSNSVLEHIPGDVLLAIMRESARVLRPGGLAVHGVNCGDHYAYADRRVTPINYLSFSEREWSFWNNDLQYQNRLRSRDFLQIAAQAGLETILAKQSPRPELLAMLPRMKIAPEFHKYPPVELASTSIDFVARRPAPRADA